MVTSIALQQGLFDQAVEDSRAVSLYKNITLALVFMSSPSLLVDKLGDVLFHNLSMANGLIFLNLIVVTALSIRQTSLSRMQKTFVVYFFLAIFYFLAIWIALYGFNLTGAGPRGIVRVFFHGICFFIIMNTPGFNIARLTDFLIRLGFVVGGLSIILYYGYMFGVIGLRAVHPPGYASDQIYYEGFGGYLNTYNYTSRFGFPYRSQSYFSEPTNFAQFLAFPLCLAWQRLFNRKNLFDLVGWATIGYAYFLTFSVANFFSFLVALALYFKFRQTNLLRKRRKFLRAVINLVLFSVTLYFMYQFYENTNVDVNESVIAKNTDQNLADRQGRLMAALSVLQDNPLGDIGFTDYFTYNAGLIGSTMILGGVFFTVILLLIVLPLARSIHKRLKESEYTMLFIGSVAFFIAFIWDGQFTENYFLFIIALYTTYVKADIAGKPL